MEISKRYDPKKVEKRLYNFWLKGRYFEPKVIPTKRKFTIVIPPPNVTDVLHLGHALNNTIQDIFIRQKRMQNYVVEWLPGVDHAGIATEVVVERELKYGMKKKLGREEFLRIVREWAEDKKINIVQQLKELGCSCDWSRMRFTLDEEFSEAVKEAFVRLYRKELIYKGEYIVNWCPRCETAISDEEVEHKEVRGYLYYIKYPLLPLKKTTVTVATTRPETMLGDTGCAVNPRDERNAKLIGKWVELPLVHRRIKIVADERVDPQFGTGVVKVTPAHDPVDFEIAKEKGLEKIVIMKKNGKIVEWIKKYGGKDREKVRKEVVEDLKKEHLLEKMEKYTYSVGHCYRCNTIIEPLLSTQWFVKQTKLAPPAIEAVEKGVIKFYPERWKGVYLNWMYNIKDWCISRQIWWGHRIPVWYCERCGGSEGIIVTKEEPKNCPQCGSTNLKEEKDVLDTWFSSWLWPFATFGWPKEKKEVDFFYPTSLLTTASEIIFFWVARMIMAGYEFIGKEPFNVVYIHGTVRDKIGRKMSKSLGNGIDPREIIQKYGADALRFSLIANAGEGADPHISENTFEGGRDFTNKIWNAYRLVKTLEKEEEELALEDKWILKELNCLIKEVNSLLKRYKLYEPLMRVYDFFWHKFCDWYLEIKKMKRKRGKAEEVLLKCLQLLHPFIPFITEEIWQKMEKKGGSITVSEWPTEEEGWLTEEVEDFHLLQEIVSGCRNVKAKNNIPKREKVKVGIKCAPKVREKLLKLIPYIKYLVPAEEITFTTSPPPKWQKIICKEVEIFIPIKKMKLEEELVKLKKEYTKVSQLYEKTLSLLRNEEFKKKAPPHIVKKEEEKLKYFEERVKKLHSYLNSLIQQTKK